MICSRVHDNKCPAGMSPVFTMGLPHPQQKGQVAGVAEKRARDGQQGWLVFYLPAFRPAQLSSLRSSRVMVPDLSWLCLSERGDNLVNKLEHVLDAARPAPACHLPFVTVGLGGWASLPWSGGPMHRVASASTCWGGSPPAALSLTEAWDASPLGRAVLMFWPCSLRTRWGQVRREQQSWNDTLTPSGVIESAS